MVGSGDVDDSRAQAYFEAGEMCFLKVASVLLQVQDPFFV
jgi:hypothetical protein